MSKIGSIFSRAKAIVGDNPLIATAATVELGKIAAPAIKAIGTDPFRDEAKNVLRQMMAQEALALKTQRLQRDMAANTARLAAMDPHLYSEVMAGRRIAIGSRVFGGQPRVDLMEQMALRMSQDAQGE